MKTPDFVLIRPVKLPGGKFGENDLQSGEFIRPIELKYVPKHVLDDERWKGYAFRDDVFCYTKMGIVPISKDNIREI